MAIRLPLTTILSQNNNDEVGAGSVNGVVAGSAFQIPQDTDNIVVKFKATTAGGGVSAQIQTTDDGGTTWYGLGRTSIVSAATGDAVQWLSIPVMGFGIRGASVIGTVPSIVSGAIIGNANPSTLGTQGGYTGLPVLSTTARIALQLQAGITSSSILTEVKVNNQSTAGR